MPGAHRFELEADRSRGAVAGGAPEQRHADGAGATRRRAPSGVRLRYGESPDRRGRCPLRAR